MKSNKNKRSSAPKPQSKYYKILATIALFIIMGIGTGILQDIYAWGKIRLFPPKIAVSLYKCCIYRTAMETLPLCNMNLLIYNPTDLDLTMELNDWRYWNDQIKYRFKMSERNIKINPGNNDVLVTFSDIILDTALFVLPDSNSLSLVITYSIKETNKLDSVFRNDKSLIKCTFWLAPVFANNDQAELYGAEWFSVEANFDKMGANQNLYKVSGEKAIYVSPQMRKRFNLNNIVDVENERFVFEPDLGLLRSKYGGLYFGVLSADTCYLVQKSTPLSELGSIGQYETYSLIGSLIDLDFSDVSEFVYMNFDSTEENNIFKEYYINADYSIFILFEDSTNIKSYNSKLEKLGYKVASIRTRRLDAFASYLTNVLNESALHAVANYINNYIDTINILIENGCFVAFTPNLISDSDSNLIIENLSVCLQDNCGILLHYDCGSLRPFPIEAPLAKHILVIVDNNIESAEFNFDSVKVEFRGK